MSQFISDMNITKLTLFLWLYLISIWSLRKAFDTASNRWTNKKINSNNTILNWNLLKQNIRSHIVYISWQILKGWKSWIISNRTDAYNWKGCAFIKKQAFHILVTSLSLFQNAYSFAWSVTTTSQSIIV